MKKLISILAIIAIMFASLFMLTGCGDDEEESTSKKNNDNDVTTNAKNEINGNNTNAANNTVADQTTVGGKVDIKDKNSYYFVVNGKKFTTDSKLKDVAAETGLVQDASAAEKDIQKNTYLIGGGYFRDSSKHTVFSVMPINNTSDTIKCSEATVGGFNLEDYYYKDYNGKITVAGGITIGNTADELVSIYGEPTEKDMREDYENLGILYKYKVGIYQYFEFEVDKKDNKITEITWRYFDK